MHPLEDLDSEAAKRKREEDYAVRLICLAIGVFGAMSFFLLTGMITPWHMVS